MAASTAWNGLRSLWLGLFALTACLLLYAVTQRLYFPYPLEWLEAALDFAHTVGALKKTLRLEEQDEDGEVSPVTEVKIDRRRENHDP